MAKELKPNEFKKVELLIEFIRITKDGMTKPFDPSPFLNKLDKLKKEGINTAGLEACCPTTAEVKDAKDFKPYINAALEEFAELMGLRVEYGNNNRY